VIPGSWMRYLCQLGVIANIFGEQLIRMAMSLTYWCKGAAVRFFRKLFKGQASIPWRIITDKLRSYRAALREITPSLSHITDQYENNRAEVSHQPTRQQERQMRRFKSPGQAQRFLSFHGLVNNLFRQQRHLLSAKNYRIFRNRAFATWEQATCVC